MSEPLAHVYDLALRALEEQERQVVELRSRLAVAMAGGGVVVTLLIRPAFRDDRSAGAVHVVVLAVGLAGLGVAALAALYLLRSPRIRFGVDAAVAGRVMRRASIADLRSYYTAMIPALDERRLGNVPVIWRLEIAFTVMLCGMLLSVCGLAAAIAIA